MITAMVADKILVSFALIVDRTFEFPKKSKESNAMPSIVKINWIPDPETMAKRGNQVGLRKDA